MVLLQDYLDTMDGEEYRRAILYKVTPNFLMHIIALIRILFGIMYTSHDFSIGAIINLQKAGVSYKLL